MHLLMRWSKDNRRLDVLRTSTSDRPARPRLRHLASEPQPGDIVVMLHDKDRRTLAEHTLPAQHMTFFDRPLKPSGDVEGRIMTWADSVRMLDLELPPDTSNVSVSRRVLDAKSRSSLIPVTELDPHAAPPSRGRPRKYDAVQLHGHSDPRRAFDIVILGDGFQRQEMKLFTKRARFLVSRLLEVEPFRSHRDLINVHAILTPSKDSGVTNCPHAGVRKDTFFKIEGNFRNAGYAGYFGTERMDIIHDALESVAPREYIDLAIVLVNSAIYGGRGDYESRTCYVPIVADDDLFIDLTIHEAAHAICQLTDEYISPFEPPTGFTALNFATEAQRLAGEVSWQRLAHGFELDRGQFRAQHRVGDPLDLGSGSPSLPNGLGDMLGLFWGCSFIEKTPEADGYTHHRFDVRGGDYYRPMARCKMRKLSAPFCRVCMHALSRAIEEAASVATQRPHVG